jgi:hypothetical protein
MDLEYDVMWKEGNMILYLREYIEIANPAEERFDAIAESHTVLLQRCYGRSLRASEHEHEQN